MMILVCVKIRCDLADKIKLGEALQSYESPLFVLLEEQIEANLKGKGK
jgi:hypothetical protein